ncbi:inhibitor of nuclear factor kappa-B kinase subunit beta [Zeugodacus cucurbitae]|uniref:inhibitor of nuclear factor kappa-B kinase subunit beta n=1 Tax=Zeugodacus cucurbitae TaxID=28588 RepID=UPI000596A695|nr:inhibitor of nuclear factor kappa-B kinase subunit beta [Zeugodacus cucurbitae]
MNNYSLGSFGKWQHKRQLGVGGFGNVDHWRNVETGQEIATKSLKENHNLSGDEIAKLKQRWRQESEWMNQLQTPYIVQGLNEKIDRPFLEYLIQKHAWLSLQPIVMEYCNEGDLRSQLLLAENTNGLIEYEVREILLALRHAIEFLHTQCRIEHRDLKPDNIVIHRTGGRRLYKLTDFGFARSTSENTMLKSIVGTRNYVAPEVLDTAEYKNTVDYWSMGIIAFELICGNLPFIPHQQLYNIIINIRKKNEKCIAITEDFNENKFEFCENIPFENRMSSVFLKYIQEWLTTALDKNYSTRGTRISPVTKERVVTFYTELDSILSQKVLKVFYLPTLTFYSYVVTPEMTLRDFRDVIKRDIGTDQFFCIFPTGHPRNQLSPTYKAIDFFVEDWQDTGDDNNPPAMLYIAQLESEYSVPTPHIPAYLKKYMNSKSELPDSLLKIIEQSTHYLLHNEQLHLEAFVCGLKEQALTAEHELFQYNTDANKLEHYFHALTEMHGRVEQFGMGIEAARQTCTVQGKRRDIFFNEWFAKANKFKAVMVELEGLKVKVSKYYRSELRRAKEMAVNKIFDELKQKDVYKLLEFRRHLDTVSNERLEVCRTAVYNCLGQREKVFLNEHLKYAYSTINSMQIEFKKLQSIVDNNLNQLHQMQNAVSQSTIEFHKALIEIYVNGNGHSTYLSQDGDSSIIVNGTSDLASSINELFQYPVQSLIDEATERMLQMDIDDDINKHNDLPATIAD